MTATKDWARALEYTKRASGCTLPGLLPSLANKYNAAPALISQQETVSYGELQTRINRYARWALSCGLKPGEVVCLLMPNCTDYLVLWLALSRIGCVAALLNSNLRPTAIEYCVRISGSRTLIIDPVLRSDISVPTCVWSLDKLQSQIAQLSSEAVDASLPSPDDRALLIYTSGTTGLPKAAIITHHRIVEWSFWFAGMMNAQPSDRLYNCLPMYHAIGGIVAPGAMLVSGGSVVIRSRFSASRFWDDIRETGSTIFQYIGELCRYLTQAALQPRERDHQLRLACGNGMQQAIWEVFQSRFAVPRVLEFYAATEGNLSLYNCEGLPGAIGRVPPYLARHFAIAIIRCDPETGVPVRNAEGFCISCAQCEPGEAISLLKGRWFDGYTNADASERKILRDVFASGDAWFRSGDLMKRDKAGFFYFVDRLGDTFRWKGENVSTTDVTNILCGCPGVKEAVVYGVVVRNAEGRAGMAALVVTQDFSFAKFEAYLQETLPEYARPVFLRLCSAIETTGTFKLQKTNFSRQGVEAATDPVWERDRDGVFRQWAGLLD